MKVIEPAGAPSVVTTVGKAPEPVIDKFVTLVPLDALVKVTVLDPVTDPDEKALRVPVNDPYVVTPVVAPFAREAKAAATCAADAPEPPAV